MAGPAPVLRGTALQFAEPFTPISYSTISLHGSTNWALATIGIVWILGFLAITALRCRSWLHIRTALRAGIPIELPIPIPAFVSTHTAEPGIVGFLRPVLVLPPRLLEHLNARQLEAVLAHEMCHVRRRDNFFAAIHMAVEAIFWFHPLVWWIGSRMVEERELACDEEVVRMGCEPADYVEGILKVCRFYTESPLPCISGVTGADVKKRLRAILAGSVAFELNAGKKIALAAVALATLAVPVVIGMLNAPAIRAQNAAAARLEFEVASIRPSAPYTPGVSTSVSMKGGPGTSDPGRVTFENFALPSLITEAYNLMTYQLSGPEWLINGYGPFSPKFEISARIPDGTTKEQFHLMLRNLLAERFKLAIHHESKDLPIYNLVVTKNGPKFKPSPGSPEASDDTGRAASSKVTIGSDGFPVLPKGTTMAWVNGRARMRATNKTMEKFVIDLAAQSGQPVRDLTGLKGEYDFELYWLPDSVAAADISAGPTLAQALQDQLGLRLESTKGPVDIVVIDHVEKVPTEN
jgi:uncharacterized protein (TIGR03435 family)